MSSAPLHLRQRDAVSCGPAVAVMAGAVIDPGYRATLTGAAGRAVFEWEQGRVHRAANRIWPRSLGTTPAGLADAISAHSTAHGVRYGWRPMRPCVVPDVERAVTAHWPVAMLVGNRIPRHWVLIVDVDVDVDVHVDETGATWHCYEPSSGEVRAVPRVAALSDRLFGLGCPRPFAVVLPDGIPDFMHARDRSNI